VAIAKGDVPVLHWFHLSRSLSPVGGGAALLSWSGSMFEYLMPSLVMHPPVGSLLDQTCRAVVRRQIAYGKEQAFPGECRSPATTRRTWSSPTSTAISASRAWV